MKEIVKKYHYVYKIINILNGMEYIGVHSTNNINDTYFGSGTYLKNAIKKYGISNFKKYIVSYFENRQDALNFEKELVNINYISKDDTYNLVIGGGNGVLSTCNKRKLFNRKERKYIYKIDIPEEYRIIFKPNLSKEEILNKYDSPVYKPWFDVMLNQIPHLCESLTILWNDSKYHEKAGKYMKHFADNGYFNKIDPIITWQHQKEISLL